MLQTEGGDEVEPLERSEVVELDGERSILLELGRRWPKYVADWSVRQRVGDSDYPREKGTVELPPSSDKDEEDVWEELRALALQQAQASAENAKTDQPQSSKRGLLDRLLGRN